MFYLVYLIPSHNLFYCYIFLNTRFQAPYFLFFFFLFFMNSMFQAPYFCLSQNLNSGFQTYIPVSLLYVPEQCVASRISLSLFYPEHLVPSPIFHSHIYPQDSVPSHIFHSMFYSEHWILRPMAHFLS